MQNDQVKQTDWQYLFEKLTATEREEVTIFMLKTLEDRDKDVIALCKENPKHLDSLPLQKLRKIAALVSEDAHALIVETHPDTEEVLYALEGLTVFSLSTDDPTLGEMKDVVSDIESIWITAGGHYESDLVKPASLAGRRQG